MKQRKFEDTHDTEWKPKIQPPVQGEIHSTFQPKTRDEQPLGPKTVHKEFTYHPTTPSFPRLYPTDDFSSKLEVTTPYKPGKCKWTAGEIARKIIQNLCLVWASI